ncbi:MAG: hypothetical protein V1726_05740 [Methanobacteriota archaeon]
MKNSLLGENLTACFIEKQGKINNKVVKKTRKTRSKPIYHSTNDGKNNLEKHVR